MAYYKVDQGAIVVTTVEVYDRDAYYLAKAKEGKTKITIFVGTTLTTATNSLGGNVWVLSKTKDGARVIVPLAQGEWEPT